MITEGTLFYDSYVMIGITNLLVSHQLSSKISVSIVVRVPGTVRTCFNTILAAGTFLVVNEYNTVFLLVAGTGGTNINAWWFCTMSTEYGQKQPTYQRVFAEFHVFDNIPEDPRAGCILNLTGDGTGHATYTLF
jgi:hypothetical protein